MRLVMPPSVSIPLASLFVWGFSAVLGSPAFLPFGAGFLGGYLFYDMLHYHVHHHRPKTALGKRLRELHMRHHFQNHERGYGVSAPFWDHVFGTAPKKRVAPFGWSAATSGRSSRIAAAGAGVSRASTERAGFEPAKECEPLTRLAGECLQPLGHLSRVFGQCKGCARSAGTSRAAASIGSYSLRRGGRAVECTSLENWRPCKRTAGSNPAPSAVTTRNPARALGFQPRG